jgi:hypothetical protein
VCERPVSFHERHVCTALTKVTSAAFTDTLFVSSVFRISVLEITKMHKHETAVYETRA